MAQPALTTDLVVAEALARWPQMLPVFIRHRMICAGCAMSRFETLEEITTLYGMDRAGFMAELQRVLETAPAAGADEGLEAGLTGGEDELDVRRTPPPHRYHVIMQALDDLGPGEALVLRADYDPWPLCYQLLSERPGEFTWGYVQQGPEEWDVRICRTG